MSDEVRVLTRLSDKPAASWQPYGLTEIWQMVESESSYITWEQHDAWRRMAELCQDQATMLANAVTELQRHWPAHPGSASESFGTIVSAFVAAMRQSATDALTNREAIGTITIDIGTARAMIASLVDQHHRYEAAERMLLPQPTPSPGQSMPPPVTEADRPPQNWRELLNMEARQIMATTDAKVGLEAQRFQTARLTNGWYGDTSRPFDPDGGSGPISSGRNVPSIPPPSYRPPLIPRSLSVDPIVSGLDGTPSDDPVLDGGAPGNTRGPINVGGAPTWWPSDALGVDRPPSGQTVAHPTHGIAVIGRNAVTGQVGSQQSTPSGMKGPPPRTGQSAVSPMPPMMGAPTSQHGQRGGAVAPGGHIPGYRDRKRRRDPDDPWATKEGNPAVIEPSPEPDEHSPGPGVLGLDR